jgi:hypothetical protein
MVYTDNTKQENKYSSSPFSATLRMAKPVALVLIQSTEAAACTPWNYAAAVAKTEQVMGKGQLQ